MALVAVIVTGIVGLAAPVITVIASRSSQDASFRQQRDLSDRAEVRKVIDASANDLNRTYFLLAGSGGVRPIPPPKLRSALAAIQLNQLRLGLRLGTDHAVAKKYHEAEQLVRSLLVATLANGGHAPQGLVSRTISGVGRLRGEFVSRAGEVLRAKA